jgi:Ni,Fe-hydrogenase III small subunit
MTREWYRYLFNLFTITGGGQANSAASSSSGQDLAPLYTPQIDAKRHGVFFDTTTQSAALINTAYPVTINSTSITDGVYIGTPTSRVYVDRIGTFNFQFSIQLVKSSASAKHVYIWYRVNGVNAANSATKVTLVGNNAAVVAAWNFVVELNAGDYFELVWSTDDTDCQIYAQGASAPVPAIPSVILTVTDNIN